MKRGLLIAVVVVVIVVLGWWWRSGDGVKHVAELDEPKETANRATPQRNQRPRGIEPRARPDFPPPTPPIPPELAHTDLGLQHAFEPWRREVENDLARCQGQPPDDVKIDLFPVEYVFILDTEVSDSEQTAYRLTSIRSGDPERELPPKSTECLYQSMGKLVMIPGPVEDGTPKGFPLLMQLFLY